MNTPTLGETRFSSKRTHCVNDSLRVPERIEIGADPGHQFEVAGPRAKLFFEAKKKFGIVVITNGCNPEYKDGYNLVIRRTVNSLYESLIK